MGIFSGIASAFKSVAKSVVKSVKTVASKVIDFAANKADKIVGAVKEWWGNVKPWVVAAQAPLRKLASATAHIPVIGAVTKALSLGVDGLLALENSPILKKIENAILWVSERAKKIEESIKKGEFPFITAEEYEAATQNRKILREAESEISQEAYDRYEVINSINDLSLALSDVEKAIQGQPKDFEHYLRLRAAQKLLTEQKNKLLTHKTLNALDQEDWFQVHVAANLIKKDPELSQKAGERIDQILQNKFGKSLQSFIYEELIASWKLQSRELSRKLNKVTDELAQAIVKKRKLDAAERIQGSLDSKEAEDLQKLNIAIPALEDEKEELFKKHSNIEIFSNAAEGFLQMLEKSEEQFIELGREYVLDEGEEVGKIIIEAAENNISFESLETEQKKLIRHFANIFKKEAERRMEQVLVMEAA